MVLNLTLAYSTPAKPDHSMMSQLEVTNENLDISNQLHQQDVEPSLTNPKRRLAELQTRIVNEMQKEKGNSLSVEKIDS